jgi:transcriptional regulator with XRE-family HTH domain
MFIVEKSLIIPNTVQIYTIILNQQGFLDFYVLYKLCIFVSKQYNTAFLKLIQYNMVTFGKRLRECRESKGFSQQELSKRMNTSYTVIGKYERDEMKPSIDVVRKITEELETTVSYLMGETEDAELFKDKKMLQRLQDIAKLPELEKNSLLLTVDNFIKATKLNLL